MIRRVFTISAICRAAKVVAAIALLTASTAPTAHAAPTVPASPNGRVTVQTLAASGPGSLAAAVAGSGSGARSESVVIDFADGLSGTIVLDETLEIGSGVTIEGPGRDQLTIRHNAPSLENGRAALDLFGGDIVISGLSIQGGLDGINISGGPSVILDNIEVSGAQRTGIRSELTSVDLIVRSSTLRSNNFGLNASDSGRIQVIDTDFIDNDWGFSDSERDPWSFTDGSTSFIRGSRFIGNGTGLASTGAPATLEETTFADNTTALTISSGDVTIRDAVFSDNGTAIKMDDGVLDVYGSRFLDNNVAFDTNNVSVDVAQSSISGGTTAFLQSGFTSEGLTIAGSTMSGINGPVVVVDDPPVGQPNLALAIVNSTIAENVAPTGGALIQVTNTDVEVIRSTVSSNSSLDASSSLIGPPTGGAGAAPGDLLLDHSILSSNPNMTTGFASIGSIDARYSVLPIGSGLAGTTIETDDVGLEPLGDNGGPTETMLPKMTSAAVDAGDPAGSPAIAIDQRRFARAVGIIDIGSVEAESAEVGRGSIGFSAPGVSIDREAGTIDVTVERTEPAAEHASAILTLRQSHAGEPVVSVSWAAGESGTQIVTMPYELGSSFLSQNLFLSISRVEGADPGALAMRIEIPASWSRTVTPISPSRLLDTRVGQATVDGLDAGIGSLAPHTVTRLVVAGRGGVPSDAGAVAANVTAVRPAATGYVTLFPCSETPPNASSLNFPAGTNVGNEVFTLLDPTGAVCVYTSVETHLTLDASAWAQAGSGLEVVEPKRVFETRRGEGLTTADGAQSGAGRLRARTITPVPIAGRVGIPSGESVVIVNITAIRPDARGFLSVTTCPDDLSAEPELPATASVNFEALANRGNEVVARADSDGQICVYTSQDVDVTVDVAGFIERKHRGLDFFSDVPTNILVPAFLGRVLDTRPAGLTDDGEFAGVGPIGAGETLHLSIDHRRMFPTVRAAGVVANVTAINAVSRGFLTMFPCDAPRPNTSSLNFEPGGVGGNEAVIELAPGGDLCIFASAEVDVTLDLTAELR